MVTIILVSMCVVAGFLDSYTTYKALRNAPKDCYEANPFADYVFKNFGLIWGGVIMMLIVMGYIFFISYSIPLMILFILLKFSVSYGNHVGKQPFVIRATVDILYKQFSKQTK